MDPETFCTIFHTNWERIEQKRGVLYEIPYKTTFFHADEADFV
jgi:hypothetical protein